MFKNSIYIFKCLNLTTWNKTWNVNFCIPANAVSVFEKCHFLSHRPLDFLNPKIRKRWQSLPFETNHFVQGRPRNFHVIINIAALENPKNHQRWLILPFEINHFLQGRPPKISFDPCQMVFRANRCESTVWPRARRWSTSDGEILSRKCSARK